jgi:protein-tyrosine phosphatase
MMLTFLHDNVRGVLSAIADAEGGVIFNCHAGKDRTGITAAICLLLAGVEDRDIIDDYAKTYTAYWAMCPARSWKAKS